MSADEQAPDRRTPLDRLVGLVTEVRAGEARLALLMALNVFLLLCAYYVIKPVREALILSTGGAELKSYTSAGQVLLLAFAVPLYSKVVDRVRRQRLIPLVTLFFLSCMLLFYAASLFAVPYLSIAFFLFVGVFNLMIVAQFWSLANDIYSREEGERIFPIIAFGASVGAVAGSGLTGTLIEPLGTMQMLLISAGLLAATIILTLMIETVASGMNSSEQLESAPAAVATVDAMSAGKEAPQADSNEAMKKTSQGGFTLVRKSRYLLLIAGLMFLANLINSNGEYILGDLVTKHVNALATTGALRESSVSDSIGKFYSDFFFVVNLAGVLLQLFVVSRVIRWWGVRGALLVLPAIALGSYVLIALFPVLALARVAKSAENATDYSLNNTVRNALFLPLSREEKFKAKQATDTFFVRGGDVASALVVNVGLSLGWATMQFAWFNVVAVVFCLIIAVSIGRRYASLTRADKERGATVA